MSTSKHIDKICCMVMALVIALTVVFVNAEKFGVTASAVQMGYEQKLFDTSRVHTIDIVMDDWDGFIDTCENEEYELCSVVIDNEAYKNVGIRAKGNTSLSMVSGYGNDRYSFKIEFDHYDNTKTYYGLDKLSLNNIIQDNTYMKDYLVYQMMGFFDVNAPLCSYVSITVNGEEWGLYLAVEGIEESFLERNYGSNYGELYKPDSMTMGGGRGNGGGFDMDRFQEERQDTDSSDDSAPDGSEKSNDGGNLNSGKNGEVPGGEASNGESLGGKGLPDNGEASGGKGFPDNGKASGEEGFPDNRELPGGEGFPENGEAPDSEGFPGNGEVPDGEGFPGGGEQSDGKPEDQNINTDQDVAPKSFGGPGGRMGGMGSDDVSLIYSDDNHDSYSNIFENAKTNISDSDKDRLIASLKKMNEGSGIEDVVNTDEVIRYFVVHNFVCNFDSYTGSMIHNYYLYEENGQMYMIPWDYNLAFGGFQSQSDASALVNYPIDTPVSGGDTDSRPMLAWILNSGQYTEQYHQYFAEFISSCFDSGYFAEMIDNVTAMIAPYVEKDPTKFCTYEQFESGAAALKEFCELRAESISGQLNGTIPSTAEGQSQDQSSLIDSSNLTISDMGSMDMGKMGRGRMENF